MCAYRGEEADVTRDCQPKGGCLPCTGLENASLCCTVATTGKPFTDFYTFFFFKKFPLKNLFIFLQIKLEQDVFDRLTVLQEGLIPKKKTATDDDLHRINELIQVLHMRFFTFASYSISSRSGYGKNVCFFFFCHQACELCKL